MKNSIVLLSFRKWLFFVIMKGILSCSAVTSLSKKVLKALESPTAEIIPSSTHSKYREESLRNNNKSSNNSKKHTKKACPIKNLLKMSYSKLIDDAFAQFQQADTRERAAAIAACNREDMKEHYRNVERGWIQYAHEEADRELKYCKGRQARQAKRHAAEKEKLEQRAAELEDSFFLPVTRQVVLDEWLEEQEVRHALERMKTEEQIQDALAAHLKADEKLKDLEMCYAYADQKEAERAAGRESSA